MFDYTVFIPIATEYYTTGANQTKPNETKIQETQPASVFLT